ARDLTDRDLIEAALGEQPAGGVRDQRACLLLLALPQTELGRHVVQPTRLLGLTYIYSSSKLRLAIGARRQAAGDVDHTRKPTARTAPARPPRIHARVRRIAGGDVHRGARPDDHGHGAA